MDTTAAAALPAFVALLLLSPWPLLGSAQGQFSAVSVLVVGNFCCCCSAAVCHSICHLSRTQNPGQDHERRLKRWLYF
ncbi:PTPRK isoform 9 [Pan troglodytes]|uniref:PTPRK isoform 9 n=1 Tax=Pan troglodytes TaxID=9598 RepID=A0A2J8PTF0_PANTR|nr:PTPRK isoform 9 [Pan troglodytes]